MPADRPVPGRRPLRAVLVRGRRWTVALALAVAASTTATLLLPAVLARAVDRMLTGGGAAGVTPLLALVGLLAVAEAGAQYAGPRGAADTTARLRSDLVRRVVAAGPGAPARPAGDLAARLTASAPQAALAGPALVYTAAQLVTAAAAVTGLALLSPLPALAFVLAAPAGWLLIRRQSARTAGHGEAYQVAQAAITTRLVEAMTGGRSIAAAGTERAELARILHPLPELARHGHGLWRSQRDAAWSVGLLAPATQLAVLTAAGAELAAGRLSPGGLAAAAAYATLGLGGFGAAQSLLDLARARSGAARTAALLDLAVAAPGTLPLPDGHGGLRFHGVGKRTGDRPLLDGLDLTIPAGRWTAVVGADDAATAAVASLAAGLDRPDTGEVALDGADLATLHPEALRAAVATAFGDPVLFGATVAEALTAGQDGIPDARIADAARAAGADTHLRRLPAGYRTPLDDAPMSGGERQRVGLARALCRDFRLLVLDDATAALDRATETAVLDTLAAHTAGRTRLSTTRSAAVAAHADLVAWLDGGRLRAAAPHHRLWRDPAYRALFTGGAESGNGCTESKE
ncbi:ABC transporter ATP-binding protein [Kitasatospora sp. NPDC049285]|uniref:ABC transporter ATP-binding protein n=1 Tax=Kitasatospora sp. NPDC049285 TaxID=3157096 RepID=UPI003447A709